MPYKLRFDGAVNSGKIVTLPAPLLLSSLTTGSSCRIEVDFDLNVVGSDQCLLFNVSDYSFLRLLPSGVIRAGYSIQSGFGDIVDSAPQSLATGQKYTLSFDLSEVRKVAELRLNGVLIGSVANRWGTYRVKDVGIWSGSSALNGHIYAIRQYQNGVLIGHQSAENVASGTALPDIIGANTMNQSGAWPTDNSEWIFYGASVYVGESTLAAVASVNASLNGTKVGAATAAIQSAGNIAVQAFKSGTATAAIQSAGNIAVQSFKSGAATAAIQSAGNIVVQASKIGVAQVDVLGSSAIVLSATKLGVGASTLVGNSALSLSGNKVGLSTIQTAAAVSADLYAGNVYIGEGTFTVSAAANIGLQGGKVGGSPVQFNAALTAYCAAEKQGTASLVAATNASSELQASKTSQSAVQAIAAITMSLGGFKIGAGTKAFLASATISLFGSAAANQTPVTLVFVSTSSRYAHNMRTSSRYNYNVKTFSGGERV